MTYDGGLKDAGPASDTCGMDPTSASGATSGLTAVYAAAMERHALGQQRVEGDQALRLIQAALVTPQLPTMLPLDATFSVRV